MPAISRVLPFGKRKTTDDPTVDEDQVLACERDYLQARLNARRGDAIALGLDYQPSGLALSGGGIRSAVYCLGVLQRLAGGGRQRNGQLTMPPMLDRFDYLSTVSGGGYIGAGFTWFLNHPDKDQLKFDCAERFPFGIDDPADTPQSPNTVAPLLRHLREHGSYLIPGHGITIWSGISVILRGFLLNLLIWIPLTALILLALCWTSGQVLSWVSSFVPLNAVHSTEPPPKLALYLWLAAIVAACFGLASLYYSFRSGWPREILRTHGGIRYRSRRAFEAGLRFCAPAVATLVVIGTLPLVSSLTNELTLGAVFTAVGTVMGLWTRFGEAAPTLRARIMAPIGATLVLYGVLLIAWVVAGSAHDSEPSRNVLFAFCVIAVLSGLWVNLNYITLHRFYRDRLMEAFMPDIRSPERSDKPAERAQTADSGWLKDMAPLDDPRGPYHLINTHLVLNDTGDAKLHQRGGDSFILSPYFCGSRVTGWRPTKELMQGEMTLATAMAISGAAVSPNAAGAGVGPQRERFVSLLMSLLNVRLGCWVPNVKLRQRFDRPTHFTAVNEYIGFGCRETTWHHLLTDGGHFDNLGVYELIRRRARFILACDATADPAFVFADLHNLIVRADNDFGAKIVFDHSEPLRCLMPRQEVAYPKHLRLSDRPYIVGRIEYPSKLGKPAPAPGVFIYLTTVLTPQLRLQLHGYAAANKAFPDETTANQFFDEARFEAYRELGFAAADQMLADVEARKLFDAIDVAASYPRAAE